MKNKNWLEKVADGESNEKVADGFKNALIEELKTPFGNDALKDILNDAVSNAEREVNAKDKNDKFGVKVKIVVSVEIDGKKEVDVDFTQEL
jgi:hypothetical protein